VRHFLNQNLPRFIIILRMSSLVLPDYMLNNLFNHEQCIFSEKAIHNAHHVNEWNGTEVGAYLYLWNKDYVKQWVRAGSAANGIKERGDEHVRASMQRNAKDRSSVFYSSFPHESTTQPRSSFYKGSFQELQQHIGVSYKKSDIDRIASLFEWDEYTETYLNTCNKKSGTELIDKKHRVICYTLELLLQMCLGKANNLSTSKGFESFLGWFGGQ
jgi:hypothetical protein